MTPLDINKIEKQIAELTAALARGVAGPRKRAAQVTRQRMAQRKRLRAQLEKASK